MHSRLLMHQAPPTGLELVGTSSTGTSCLWLQLQNAFALRGPNSDPAPDNVTILLFLGGQAGDNEHHL